MSNSVDCCDGAGAACGSVLAHMPLSDERCPECDGHMFMLNGHLWCIIRACHQRRRYYPGIPDVFAICNWCNHTAGIGGVNGPVMLYSYGIPGNLRARQLCLHPDCAREFRRVRRRTLPSSAPTVGAGTAGSTGGAGTLAGAET
jgi:hypothetical protein